MSYYWNTNAASQKIPTEVTSSVMSSISQSARVCRSLLCQACVSSPEPEKPAAALEAGGSKRRRVNSLA